MTPPTDEARPDPNAMTNEDELDDFLEWKGGTDEARAGEPRTEAGRTLLATISNQHAFRAEWHAAILAIEREAAAAPALDVSLMERIVRNGVPPDALMDSSPAGQNLRDWWLNRWAPVLNEVRAALSESAPPVAPVGEDR